MNMLRIITLAGVVAIAGTGVAFADAIADRQAILKSWGDDAMPVGKMMKGEAPFDIAKVKAALANFQTNAPKLKDMFPDNSRTGKTEASPRIWDEKARFLTLFDKLATDAGAAAGAITDEASFKANFGKVFGDCKACHDDFRIKK